MSLNLLQGTLLDPVRIVVEDFERIHGFSALDKFLVEEQGVQNSPRVLRRKDCPRVHYDYDRELLGVKLFVPGLSDPLNSGVRPFRQRNRQSTHSIGTECIYLTEGLLYHGHFTDRVLSASYLRSRRGSYPRPYSDPCVAYELFRNRLPNSDRKKGFRLLFDIIQRGTLLRFEL